MALTDVFRSLFTRKETPPSAPAEVTLEVIEAEEPETPAGPRRIPFLQLLEQGGPFSPEEAVAFALQVSQSLLSERLDVRLQNVSVRELFFTPDGELGATLGNHARFDGLSPEEVRGQPVSARTDVFKVGLFFHSALVGGPAIARGDSDFQTLERVRDVELVPFRTQLPREVETVVRKCLHAKPERRYESLAELCAVLKELPRDESKLKHRVAGVWSRKKDRPTPLADLELATDTSEAQLVERIRSGDEAARAVYADLLETEGRGAEAAWLRLEQRMRSERGGAQLATLTELRALNVSLAFMSSVSRADLEECAVTFGFKCPRTWNALARTEDPSVRWCTACQAKVHFATSFEAADQLAREGRCVAVADTVERNESEPLGTSDTMGPASVGMGPVRRAIGRKR